jgi:hypothetical protein
MPTPHNRVLFAFQANQWLTSIRAHEHTEHNELPLHTAISKEILSHYIATEARECKAG